MIKKALISFSPLEVGLSRIAISFLAFLPILFIKWKQIPKNKFKALWVVAMCGSAIPAVLYAVGQTQIPSAVAGVLNSMTPIFTFILAILVFKQKFYTNQMSGILLAFMGIGLLFLAKDNGSVPFQYFYAFIILIATINYAISANTVKAYLSGISPMLISVVSFSLIGPIALILLWQTGINDIIIDEQTLHSLGALFVLSLVCTFLANILFFRLIQMTDAIFSTSVSFLIPFVALGWGIIDGEPIGVFHFMALVLILGGIFLIRRKG